MPVAAVVDVTWDSPVLVAVALLGHSFACYRLGYPGCPSQVPVPNRLHHYHYHLLLRLLASHHTLSAVSLLDYLRYSSFAGVQHRGHLGLKLASELYAVATLVGWFVAVEREG